MTSEIRLIHPIPTWGEDNAQNITFIVTEDCQLQCKYCYICGKNTFSAMTFEIARKGIDYILSNRHIFSEAGVVWDFIGGEPFLEVDLIDKICDYAKVQMYKLNHPWFENYRINFSSNGLLFDRPEVQAFIEKNRLHLSIGISIDGTKEKHDLQRVFPDGSGSYDEVVKKIPLWKQMFSDATKATISHEDLHLVKDSVLHLWELGISDVAMNVIFEDVWQEGDDDIFEQQLIELADIIIEKKLYVENKCSLFDRSIGFPLDREKNNDNWCGAGRMLCIDTKGIFHPCARFAQYSLNRKKSIDIGNVEEGYDFNKIRPFLTINRCMQSPPECLECEVASGCAWCQACNYDNADTDTIYQRHVGICKMHKARVRANNYLWNRLDQIAPPEENDVRTIGLRIRKGLQSLFVLIDSNAASFCHYSVPDGTAKELMTPETLGKVVYYAKTNNLSLNLVVGEECGWQLKRAARGN